MKPLSDSYSEYTSSVDTDIRTMFDRVWRDMVVRDDAQEEPSAERSSIWLECNGELVDLSLVKVVRVQKVGGDAEIVEFVCPRCKEPHESLRFS